MIEHLSLCFLLPSTLKKFSRRGFHRTHSFCYYFCSYCGEFDNFGAVMSVSEDLLCSFELLKPLDGAALKKEMTKSKRKSQVLNVFFFFSKYNTFAD